MNKILLVLLAFLCLLAPVFGHSDSADGGGFSIGFTHPVLGFDHLLAMLSVGILSLQMGGKAIWGVPCAFVLVMLVGGILGILNIPFFSVEIGIALSVIFLGVSISINRQFHPMIAVAFVSFFALFHGHAHGTEMPSIASPYLYALGFVLGTSIIHLAGVFIGVGFSKINQGTTVLRHVGSAICGAGVHILLVLMGI
jgi:urease accessory protein